jgi:hypothetical protein
MTFPDAASTLWLGVQPPGKETPPLRTATRTKLARLIARSQPAVFIAESGSASDFEDQLRPFLARIGSGQLSDDERLQFQHVAARWLAHLSQPERSTIFDLKEAEEPLSVLIDDPDLAPTALVALAGIASPDVQQRLRIVAINKQQSAEIRTAAANQLAAHIHQHGVLLTADAIRELTRVWRGETDPMVASALASVISSLKPGPVSRGSDELSPPQ